MRVKYMRSLDASRGRLRDEATQLLQEGDHLPTDDLSIVEIVPAP